MPYYYTGFYIDPYYILLVLPALLITVIAQISVKSTYAKYAKVGARGGMTAAQICRRILDQNGLTHISLEPVAGDLTDHYDPKANVIRLSETVMNSSSIAAIGVAAHEAGHAVQYATGYGPIKLRAAIIPVTNIGTSIAPILLLLGLLFSWQPLISIGLVGFALMVLFQLITLPVEFNASSRALRTLEDTGVLIGDELSGARKVLRAAASTYVAALLVSLANFLRLFLLFGRGNRR